MIEAIIAKVHQTLNRIGANTDTSGTATIFARLAQIAGYTDNIEPSLGSDADASSASGSAHGKLKDIKSFLTTNIPGPVPNSPIKSIQRGTTAIGTTYPVTQDITISNVNAAKTMVNIVSEHCTGTNGSNYNLTLTSPTNIQFYASAACTSGNLAWEVIEYV